MKPTEVREAMIAVSFTAFGFFMDAVGIPVVHWLIML
jgi:hypothetical protein